MNNNNKYVNALFLGAGALVWFLSLHYTEVIFGYFQLGRILGPATDILLHLLPLALGVVTFLILRLKTASYDFVAQSVSEVARVVWPTKKDVQLGTIVVIVAVLLAGLALGLLDMLLTSIVKTVLGLGT